MITRSGFVSNSSSSSFIIGIAKVPEGTKKIKGDLKIEFDPDSHYGIKGVWYPLKATKIDEETYKISLTSFMDTEVSTLVKDGDNIIYLNGTGPDEDSCFWNGDYYDYDIDLSDFSSSDQEKYNLILSLKGEVDYGAGRDG